MNENISMKRGKMRNTSKKSQLTIFVIIAIAIVAVLLIAFYPSLKKLVIPQKPVEMIPVDCMQEAVKSNFEEIMLHGGEKIPELYFNYNNQSLNYLCYTSEWYKTCVMQKPFLKQDIEREVVKYSNDKIKQCLNNMIETLRKRGYSTKITGDMNSEIQIAPEKILIIPNIQLALEKAEETMILDKDIFKISMESNSYDIIMIASSIQNYEARFGDSETESYMSFYPNIRVEKIKQSDGTKVYIISDRETEEKLQFATRSLAWPPGYVTPLEFADAP